MTIRRVTAPTAWSPVQLKRVEDVLDEMSIPFGWTLVSHYDGIVVVVQIEDGAGVDNRTDAPKAWRGRKWLLSRHMTDGEIAQTVLMAVLTAMGHEVRELVTFKGRSVFDPHYDLGKLHDFRGQPGAIKGRD